MSKLSFRARALDASKPMPIFMAEELPDLPDYSAINRAVPQMPSGMEKEEECEHHLQRAICAGIIIPTPEVSDMADKEAYDKLYPANYKQPRQLIHMQPFTMEQDIPDYDMDSEDERWLVSQAQKLEINAYKFEEMMDRLEKSSGQTVVTLYEAKALLKEDDDLIIAVYDYWLNKRLKLQHPLILSVKTEHRAGTAANNPYLAFRRRTDKMQTRKIRKNDETSYEKMLKLKRDLCRAVTLLELVKRREKIKREYVHLTVEVFEKRYQAKDFSGAIVAELSALKPPRPDFTPIFHNHYANQGWSNKAILKDEIIPRKEKRQYKKRKHKSLIHSRVVGMSGVLEGVVSSDEEPVPRISPEPEEVEDEGQFAFRRNKLCSYHLPIPNQGNWPWCSKEENGLADKRYRYTLTSLSNPRRCIGFARRRVGRGGRIILDRAATDFDDFWRTVDFTIYEPEKSGVGTVTEKSDDYSKSNSYATVKSEPNDFSHYDLSNKLRTSVSETNSSEVVGVKKEIKVEPTETPAEDVNILENGGGGGGMETTHQDEQEEMVEFLRSVRRDWLHFRPKTPPPDYEPPCNLLPADDSVFIPSANTPFSLELQVLDPPSSVLDTSSFVSGPFSFEDLDITNEVPITDTRQQPSSDKNVQTGVNSNVNVCLNTLTSSVNDFDVEQQLKDRTMVGCSKFNVFDTCATSKKQLIVSSTLTSPKFNSVNVLSDVRSRQNTNVDSSVNNANGLLSQFGLDGSPGCKTKSNKLPYAYPRGGSFCSPPASTLSLHTSAHTVTLNSHSANVLEIPLPNDTDKVSNKVVNSQCTETSGTPPNNKNKTIVRKNNLVMEVT